MTHDRIAECSVLDRLESQQALLPAIPDPTLHNQRNIPIIKILRGVPCRSAPILNLPRQLYQLLDALRAIRHPRPRRTQPTHHHVVRPIVETHPVTRHATRNPHARLNTGWFT